jgi:hypothetical protein
VKILAIGLSLLEIKVGCYAILKKYMNRGHEAYVIVAGNDSESNSTTRSFYKINGISETYFIKSFQTSIVTQNNVKLLESIIKKKDPSLVIVPFHKSTNDQREVLGKSSIIACRGIRNIIMYELDKNNTTFVPNIFCSARQEIALKPYCFEQCENVTSEATGNNKDNKIIGKRSYFRPEHLGQFECYKGLLLDDSEVF